MIFTSIANANAAAAAATVIRAKMCVFTTDVLRSPPPEEAEVEREDSVGTQNFLFPLAAATQTGRQPILAWRSAAKTSPAEIPFYLFVPVHDDDDAVRSGHP